jgi:hypothetical protein
VLASGNPNLHEHLLGALADGLTSLGAWLASRG